MSLKQNLDIRQCAEESAVMMWQIAGGLGIADTTLSRWMRQELPSDTKQRIYEIINRIVKEREEETACS